MASRFQRDGLLFSAGLSLAIFFCAIVASTVQARAVAEFCPASLQEAPVKGNPGNLYGLEMNASSSRTLSATLAFDTSAGWFTVVVPAISFSEKDRHYTGPSSTFVRRDWISPVFYVRFPSVLKIAHLWVASATLTAETGATWQENTPISCAPPAFFQFGQNHLPQNSPTLDPKDEDPIAAPPEKGSLVFAPFPSPPLGTTDCRVPFLNGTTTDTATAQFPDSLRAAGTSGVTVALDASGNLVDAWITEPSGYTRFDNAALEAARRSKYAGARSYCRPVPSIYVFKVTFRPY